MTATSPIADDNTKEDKMNEAQKKTGEIVEMEPANLPAQAVTPMQMLQIAVEQGADLDRLEKLMDMQERWEANEARKAFVVAKAAFKAEAPKLSKNKHVSFNTAKGDTDYDHATLDHIADELNPVLSKHGLSYSWETDQIDGGIIRVTCVLTHVQGHAERVPLQSGADQSGGKNNIQAIGSTVSYLQRYTLLAATGMATADMDTDGIGPVELISAEQKETLVGLMKEVEADTGAFLKYMGVAALDNLPANLFDNALAALEKKRKI